MANGSFFIQRPEDAMRHVGLLVSGLKKIAIAGWIGGAGCGILALFVSHFLVLSSRSQPGAIPGTREISGVILVTWFMALTLLFFSTLYYLSGWALAHKQAWGRYLAAGTFLLKVALCVWLGRGSGSAIVVFLLIAGWDLYGLWVLLSKEAGQLVSSPDPIRPNRSALTSNLLT